MKNSKGKHRRRKLMRAKTCRLCENQIYNIDFKGCKSCFACKLKNSKTNGVCALKDDLRPVLERCRQADVIVLGSIIATRRERYARSWSD